MQAQALCADIADKFGLEFPSAKREESAAVCKVAMRTYVTGLLLTSFEHRGSDSVELRSEVMSHLAVLKARKMNKASLMQPLRAAVDEAQRYSYEA